jgi:lysophospholipase L1-like esterase
MRVHDRSMEIAPDTRLLFIGDSVTDCARLRLVGEGSGAALGQGYVAAVDAVLGPLYPTRPIRIANMGISGNTVRDLASRWDADVLELGPDWLAVMIGINDVWRQFDGVDSAAAVMPDEFGRTYEALVARALPGLKRLVLLTPFYVQSLRTDPMRLRTDEYGSIVRELAARHGALLVDTQAAMDRALARGDFGSIAGDRVHPTHAGHEIIARAFLRAIGVTPGSRL